MKGSLAIGGGITLGIGLGFLMLPNALGFIGFMMGGLGFGLILSSIITIEKVY